MNWRITMLAIVLLAAEASVAAPVGPMGGKQGADNLPLGLYLADVGKRLDCYFTIEQTGYPSRNVMSKAVQPDPSVKSIADVVGFLGRALEDYEVFQSPGDPAVVHIVAAKTRAIKDYWLDRRMAISFDGVPERLLGKILTSTKGAELETSGSIGDRRGGDMITHVKVVAIDMTARSVLTEFLPLARYSRLLWVATTTPKDGTQVVSVWWCGMVKPQEKPSNKLVPFSEGEDAFYRNEKSPEAIAAAIDYINAQMNTEKPFQVRWAMFFLGESGVAEAVPLLSKHLTYKYTTCGFLEDSYPAVRALSNMGKTGSAATLKAIGTEADSLRLKLLCRVVLRVEGEDNGPKAVEAEAAKADQVQQQRIRDALKAAAEPQALPAAPAAK
jgi:hypothetical protein